MHAAHFLLALTGAAALAVAAPAADAELAKRGPTDTTIVYLNQCSGSPQLFSQGILYGFNANSPPQSYLQELGVNYEAAGGAQTDSQPSGYAVNRNSYNNRFASVVAVWKRVRQQNGVMIVKMADLWGADFTQPSNFPYPGDNGDWTLFDNFINQVISDIKSSGMALSYSTQLELWNEPDINFGNRPQSQYNAMYVRGTKALRAAFPSGSNAYLPLVGPSTSSRPYNGNGWWNSFLSYLQNNGGRNVQPDVWNWHLEENNNNDPAPPAQYLPGYVQSYGLTTGIGLQNNEFGIRNQQYPGYSAWFKGRYERLKFNALRGNWASAANLSDLLADLLIKNSDGSYSTTGEYQVYKYYKLMTGAPCNTAPGTNLDSYATATSNNATVLVGSQSTAAGTWATQFQGISSKFGSATTVKAQVLNIAYNNGGAVSGWTNLGGQQTLTVVNDAVTVNVDVGTTYDAKAIRLTL